MTDADEPFGPEAAMRLAGQADPTDRLDALDVEAEPPLFAGLEASPRPVISTAFDALIHSSSELRRASFYIGVIVLGLGAPLAVLAWRAATEPSALESLDFLMFLNLAMLLAIVGVLAAAIESRAVAIALLAARLAGRPMEARDAVRRSRTVFWRLLWAVVLANLPLVLIQTVLQERAAEAMGGESEFSILGASLLSAVLLAPLAYVQTWVVLGDVGPVQAVRRSVAVFRARKRLGVVVAVFEFGAQFLTAFGLLAGLDLVLRLTDVAGLGSGGDMAATAVIGALMAVFVFAAGTLLFTVSAVAAAPQVVGYLAINRAAPGLERLRSSAAGFRWFPRRMLAAIVAGALVLWAGLGTAT